MLNSIWIFLTVTLPSFFKLGKWLKSVYDNKRSDIIDKHFNDTKEERNKITRKIKKARSDKERNKLLNDLYNLDK